MRRQAVLKGLCGFCVKLKVVVMILECAQTTLQCCDVIWEFAVTWFQLFQTDKIPGLFQYFLPFSQYYF